MHDQDDRTGGKHCSRLKQAGITSDDISALPPDKRGTKDVAREPNTRAPEGATSGGLADFGVAAAVGRLARIGALATPDIGPSIAAGAIMAALGGATAGTAAGSIVGALAGIGIPEFEAKRYEAKIREGNMLISVRTEDGQPRDVAKDIFKRNDAENISSASEASVK